MHILKGILEKFKKFYYNFLWQSSSEFKGSHWVRWEKLVGPKALGVGFKTHSPCWLVLGNTVLIEYTHKG
jgi:hypothetical protein